MANFMNTLANWGSTAKNVLNNPLTQIGLSYYSNRQANDAIGDATRRQTQANTQAANTLSRFYGQSLDELRGAYDEGRNWLAPYRQAGAQGLSGYQNIMANPQSITQRPGYQFRLDQGLEALDRRIGANRMLNSGNRMAGITEYAQNYATDELDSELQRNYALAQMGQGATNTLANLGYNYSRGIAGLMDSQGANQANLATSRGDILGTQDIAGAQIDRNLFMDILGAGGDWWSSGAKKS